MRTMLELHYYRQPMLDFVGAAMMDRHIVHTADIGPDSLVLDVGAFTGEDLSPFAGFEEICRGNNRASAEIGWDDLLVIRECTFNEL